MLSARRVLLILLFSGLFIFSFREDSFADTTPYRSAQTVTSDGLPPFTNLGNCSATDGLTCDKALANSFGDLDFRFFGDFGIPDNATITNVRIRVTGKLQVPAVWGTTGPYVFLSRYRESIPHFYETCEFPSDMWSLTSLSGSSIKVREYITPMTNGILANCLSLASINNNNFIFRIHFSSSNPWSANIDNFEIAFDYTPPPGPQPFLDLPWDYEAKGQTFADAALSINSYFDHEYPLLSSGLSEPAEASDTIIKYKENKRVDDFYSSHDGYDYAIPANVHLGNPVLAAAAGTAEYINSCTPCGNMIVIDHGNGYQTRYLHMQKDGLIVSQLGVKVHVNAHQQIGKVGATGNVSPAGDAGAHIHFGVFEDKNHDGNFDDNVPDGVTDPFGWQSLDPDPWPNYSFFFNGMQRTGNKSYYLWKKPLGGVTKTITQSGGSTSSGHFSFTFPQNAVSGFTNLIFSPESIISPSTFLSSVGPTILAIAKDQFGNPITNFLNPFTLTVDFAGLDLSRFDTSTLSIYSSQDGQTWTKENTTFDWEHYKASATLSHFTHFALMANRLDTIAPTTGAVLSGDKGDDDWYHSDVSVLLNAQDNPGGLGVDYTLFSKDGQSWETYSEPIIATEEGYFKYNFRSVDKDGNVEEEKSVEFNIDKTSPKVSILTDKTALWAPNGKLVPLTIYGEVQELNSYTQTFNIIDEYENTMPIVSDFGDTVYLEARRNGYDYDGRSYTIKVKASDLAGNESSAQTVVIVPHDQSKK